ncbi:HET-domain-containing protein [Apiospora sp. TS-2023a]
MDNHPNCAICLDLYSPEYYQQGFPDSLRVSNRDITIGQLEASTISGCLFCHTLLQALQAFWPDLSSEQGVVLHLQWGSTPEVGLLHREREEFVEVYTSKEWGLNQLSESLFSITSKIPYRSEISESGACGEAFQFLEKCLKDCTEEENHGIHENCTTGWFVPTRLVEICESGAFRVVQLPPDTDTCYTALSYCWGQGSSIKATSANIDLLAQECSISELPAVLRDAISITRKLGIDYIWIDALCILQDDASDWEREASFMDSIYKEAYLTIAASSSSDVHDSFLDRQSASHSVGLQLETFDGRDLHIRARKRPACGVHASFEAPDPWRRRAWTFQEQQLATRLISFTANELQWRCKGNPDCECGDVKHTVDWRFPYFEPEVYTDERTMAELSDFWHNAVMQYSPRDLTFVSDKLPAISGLWASVDGLVGYWYSEHHVEITTLENLSTVSPVAEVLQAEVSHTGDNPYGSVYDGFLVIQAGILPVTMETRHDSRSKQDEYLVSLFGEKLAFGADVSIDVVASWPNELPTETFGVRSGSQNYISEENIPGGISFTRLAEGSPRCTAWVVHLMNLNQAGRKPRRYFLVVGKSLRKPGAFERLGLLIQELGHESGSLCDGSWNRETMMIV